MSYNTKNYKTQGGDKWVVGGNLEVKGSDGNYIDVKQKLEAHEAAIKNLDGNGRLKIPLSYTLPQSATWGFDYAESDEVNAANGKYRQSTVERAKQNIDEINDFGLSNIFIRVSEQFNDSNERYHNLNVEQVVEIAKYIIQKGKTVSIKMHTSTMTTKDATWKTFHTTYVTNLMNAFDSENIELKYYIDFNEDTFVANSANVTYINSVFDIVGERAIKGISFAGFGNALAMQSGILDSIDIMAINLYPAVGTNNPVENSKLTTSEIASAVNTYLYDTTIKQLKTKTNKPVFITEIGCCPYWEAFDHPEAYDFATYDCVEITTGEPNANYINGVLNVFNDFEIEGLGIWFRIEYQSFKNMMKGWL